MLDELRAAGLTEAEAKTYVALLKLGETTAGPLIKKTGMHRATVYDALKRLQEKGLVASVVVMKTHKYSAATPDELLKWQEEKTEELKSVLPLLRQVYDEGRKKQEVWVYQGKKGIRTVMNSILDELNPDGEYLDFGVSGKFRFVMGPYWDIWQRTKRERGIRARCIFSSNLKADKKFLNDYFGSYRFHPAEFESPTDTLIYNDKVALFIWEGDPPIAIVIKNRENAEGYRRQFWMMWKFAEPGRE